MKEIIIKHIVSHGGELIVVMEDNTMIIAPNMETVIKEYRKLINKRDK